MSNAMEQAAAAMTAEAMGEWAEAIEIWRGLADDSPDIRWWLRLADAYESAGQPETADEVRADAVTETLHVGEPIAAMVAACAAKADVAGLFAGRRDLAFIGTLSAAEFETLAPALSRRSLAEGEFLIREGEPARTLYILARGQLNVTRADELGREVSVARLTPGAVVGEMALVLDRPRTASVHAAEACELIQVELDTLRAIAETNVEIGQALRAYADERLVAAVVATSPLLRGVVPSARGAVLEGFNRITAERGDKLAQEGTPTRGVFVVAVGRVAVRQQDDGVTTTLATLGPGEVFGEIALLGDGRSTATVEALEASTLLTLSADDFRRLYATHPAVRAQMQHLRDERVQANRSIFAVPTLELEIIEEVEDFTSAFEDDS